MADLLDDLDQVGGLKESDLRRDRMLRHAVERILAQLVDLAVAINGHVAVATTGRAPTDYRSSFDALEHMQVLTPERANRLRRSVGMRNVLSHEYVRIDLALVAAAVTDARADYREYVGLMASWIAKQAAEQERQRPS